MAMPALQRKKAHREWMIRNLTTSVILYDRVTTTVAKAKEVRRWVDRMITLGKTDSLVNRRRLLAWFPDRNAPKKIWEVLVPRYSERTGGYTRFVRMGVRVGDTAPTMLIELMPAETQTVSQESTVEPAAETPKRRLPSLRKPKASVTVRRKGSK